MTTTLLPRPDWLARLRSIAVLRPGQRVVHLPGIGISVSRRAVSAGGAADWWEAGGATGCIAAYQPKGAASLAASYSNLDNPGTYDAVEVGAPTFDTVTGWGLLRSSNQCLDTGIVPTSAYSVAIRFSDVPASGSDMTAFGQFSFDTGNGFYYRPNSASGSHDFACGHSSGALSPAHAGGVAILAGPNLYIDGTLSSSVTAAAVASITLYIGAIHASDGNRFSQLTGNIQAFAMYSGTLDATQAATLSSAMAAL